MKAWKRRKSSKEAFRKRVDLPRSPRAVGWRFRKRGRCKISRFKNWESFFKRPTFSNQPQPFAANWNKHGHKNEIKATQINQILVTSLTNKNIVPAVLERRKKSTLKSKD